MIDIPYRLKNFVEKVAIKSDGTIHIAGRRTLHSIPQANSGRTEAALIEALFPCVYECVYTRSVGLDVEPTVVNSSNRDITELLATANGTRSHIEHDWIVQHILPNGAVVAGARGRTRQFEVGQFTVTDGELPIRPGSKLAVILHTGSRRLQSAFYHCFSEGFLDSNECSPSVRLYFNVRLASATSFVSLVTGVLNRYEIPFRLKVATQSDSFVRADNSVLYVAQRFFPLTAMAIALSMPGLQSILNPFIPLFTKRLASGIGLAEDPGGTESFGTSRSKLVAAAILASRRGERIPLDLFTDRFREVVSLAKLRFDALHLNPGSEDTYFFPSSKRFNRVTSVI